MNQFRNVLSLSAACLLVLSVTQSLQAELPPQAYANMQADAPEFVTIDVIGVKAISTPQPDPQIVKVDVVLTARVKSVTRSATNLKTGSIITIIYTHTRRPPMPGASEIPIMGCGKSTPAFLKQIEGRREYRPVAGGYSFEVVEIPDMRKVS
jgi:hypothetical protein